MTDKPSPKDDIRQEFEKWRSENAPNVPYDDAAWRFAIYKTRELIGARHDQHRRHYG